MEEKLIKEVLHPEGRAWSYMDDLVTIRPAFDLDGRPNRCWDSGLGVPRGYIGRPEAYQAAALWLETVGITHIAGPILSGAQMAHTVALFSRMKIRPIYIPKDGYHPKKHCIVQTMTPDYAIIDDIVESGEGLFRAIEYTRGKTGFDPKYIIADSWSWGTNKLAFLETIKDRLYIITM